MLNKVWQDKTGLHNSDLRFYSCFQRKIIDGSKIERALFVYETKTEIFKNLSKEQTNKLFLSLLEPHTPVTLQTISKWSVQTIQIAYENKKVKLKGNNTRTVGPSLALFNGASMKSIMDSAD